MIVDNLINEINTGRAGKSWGFGMGLPKLEDIVDGVSKGVYYLVFATSGTGKSNFMMHSFIYKPLMEHLDDENFFISLFALEMKAEIIMAKLLCTHIYENYGVELSFKELLSKKKGYTLSDEYLEIVKECEPWLRKVEQKLFIYDKAISAESFYAVLMKELQKRGRFEETENRKIYIPNNPELTHLVAIDHIGLVRCNQGRTKKQEIDLISNYLVTLRNACGISPLVVMQSNRDSTSMDRRKAGFYGPQLSDLKDSGGPGEDAEIILGVYDPTADKLATHNNYNLKELKGIFRSIVCLKNRYGDTNVEDCCAFYGKTNVWKELPPPTEITNYERYKHPDWTIADTISNIQINNAQNSNFIM
jgi:replicative DNA helicase